MRCARCRHDNPGDGRFCNQCGARLELKCGTCDHSNPPASRFCGGCGRELAEAAAPAGPGPPEPAIPKHLADKILTSRSSLEGERKQVTVLFADLKGSLELLADRDPEEARKLLDPLLEQMMEAVHRYEGTVNQVMGDGIMALFGAPVAHEDHAVRGCYAALRMQESARRYAEGVRRAEGIAVQIRIGLNSGEVVVRSIGSDLRMDYTAVGQTTHLAARMEQLASPGTILITPATLALAEGHVSVRGLGPVNIRGLGRPMDVYEVSGGEPGRTRFHAAARRGLSRFVGRDEELEQLRHAIAQAGEGRGQVVAVVGEPGVGKSRLFHEFTHSHRTEGWLVLASGSVSYGKATAYLPVTDLLRAYFRIEERDEIRAVRAKVTGNLLALDQALDDCIAPVLWLLEALPEDSPFAALDPPQRRHRTLEAVKRLLLRESQARPLVVVVEDLHWIDSETQALLDTLVDSVPTARVLLLVNYRPEYQHGWGGRTYYRQLRIDPLQPESAAALLDTLLGGDPSLRHLRRLLIERTEGNPLFLEESVRTLVETGALDGERGAYRLTGAAETIEVPPTVQAILAARIDRLAPEDKRLLQAASVIGTDVPWPLLLAVADLPDPDLRSGLARLQAAEFLYETRLFPDIEYTFKHALTHEVAYGTLLHDRRRALHGRIAEAIERLAGDRIAEHAPALARHALRGERWEQALAYSRQAASRAQAQSAYREAVGYLEQALVALAHLPAGPAMVEQAIDVRLELRNALFGPSEHGRIIGYLREAAELARASGDQRRLARAVAILALSLWATGQHELAIASASQAQEIAVALGDESLEVLADFYLGVTRYAVGDYRRSISHLRRDVDRLSGERLRERFGLMGPPALFCRQFLAWSLAEMGEFEEAVALGLEALRLADLLGEPYSQLSALIGTAGPLLRRGDVARVRPILERALELGERWALPVWGSMVTAWLGSAVALSGRPADGLDLLERALGQTGPTAVRASRPLNLTYLGETLLALGRVAEARQRAGEALALARELGERGHEAWALRLLGEVDDAAGRGEAGAAARYRDALALAGRLEMRPLAARCHLGLGRLAGRAGRRDEALAHLERAVPMLREMGMEPWLQQALAERDRMAPRP
jgi:class 3 adenylate cyclase/tetratricopeptide (TPR) repeat protein